MAWQQNVVFRSAGALRAHPRSALRTANSRHGKIFARLYSRLPPANNKFLRISDRVRSALTNGKPVVALETTIYTHGFPYPDNVALAEQLSSLAQSNSAVPAHIGVLDGCAIVGMDDSEMVELLRQAKEGIETIKLSRRDLGYIAGQGQIGRKVNGGTTIAGTMVLAHLAGIQVFATGGLGGVHKGGENSMDVSADLTELGRTPVALISSGCKSFLDIPRTLEYLETQGAGVGTFADGRSGQVEFPAFWTRNSGTPSPRTITNEEEAAAIIYAQSELGLQSGLFFANPIAEEYSLDKAMMDEAMSQAVRDAEKAGVTGHANTPFVLSRIREITQGRTIRANRELVCANVVRGAKVATALAALQGAPRKGATSCASNSSSLTQPNSKADIQVGEETKRSTAALERVGTVGIQQRALCKNHLKNIDNNDTDSELVIYAVVETAEGRGQPKRLFNLGHGTQVLVAGSVALDTSCDLLNVEPRQTQTWVPGVSNRAKVSQSVGGVGGNLAKAASYAGAKTTLFSTIGDDAAGKIVTNHFSTVPSLHPHLFVNKARQTAIYVAFNEVNGGLNTAAADMAIFEQSEAMTLYRTDENAFQPDWLVLDSNWSAATLASWLDSGIGRRIAFEPVSAHKSTRLLEAMELLQSRGIFPRVDLMTPNVHELRSLYAKFTATPNMSFLDSTFVRDVESSGVLSRLADVDGYSAHRILAEAATLLEVSRGVVVTLGSHGIFMVKELAEDDPLSKSQDAQNFIFKQERRAHAQNDRATLKVDSKIRVYVRHFPAHKIENSEVVSVNGAGDTFLGALVAGLTGPKHYTEDILVPVAQRCAAMTLKYPGSVSPDIQTLAGKLRKL